MFLLTVSCYGGTTACGESLNANIFARARVPSTTMRHRNRNTVFPHLTYELALDHLHRLEECVEAYRLPAVLKRQVPVAVCTIIEQFCRTKKMFMYEAGEPMPQELTLNVLLVMDMLDQSDSWCVDNTRRHEKVIRERVKDITNDGSFKICTKDLDALIDEACDMRQPLLVESLAASTLNFQSVEAVNSLDIASPVFDKGISVDGYDDLFERRHTHTHTLEDTEISPRACIALAKDLFEAVLGRNGFAFYDGRALSEAGRHEGAVRSLKLARGRSDWKYLVCYGRSLAHVGDSKARDVLHEAVRSLLGHTEAIPKRKKREATWLRVEAARAMCDLADGFRATGAGDYEEYVDRTLKICDGSADAYWSAGTRLTKFGFPHDTDIEFSKKAYELAGNVNTAYEVGMTCLKLERYGDAVEWLKKAENHDPRDMDVKLALEQAENGLPP